MQGPTINVRILESSSDVAMVADQWRRLESVCVERFTYFQTHDWCAKWIAEFCAGPAPLAAPRIITLWQGDDLVLLWPAMLSNRKMGAHVLQTLGEPHTQYANCLVAPGCDEAALKKAFNGAIEGMDDIDIVALEAVPADSALTRMVNVLPVPTETANEAAFYALDSFGSWDDIVASLSKSTRKGRKKRMTRLVEQLGEPELHIAWGGTEEYRAMVTRMMAWKRRWIEETGRVSVGFSITGYDDFVAGLAGDPGAKSGALAMETRVDGQPIGIEMGCIHHGHYYAYVGGFDYTLYDLSPGKIAMELGIQWLKQAGIKSYDLLGNPADYKASWSTDTVALERYSLVYTLRGRLYGDLWMGWMRPNMKRAFYAAPETWRKAASRALTSQAAAG